MQRLLLSVLILLSLASTAAVKNTVSSFPGTVQVTVDPWTTTTMVDLLFVIDNSGSMSSHQDALARGTEALLNSITAQGWNLQVGVITTDVSDESAAGVMLRPWTNVSQGDFVTKTKANMLVGTHGSADESPLDAMVAALGRNKDTGLNAGFRRAGARLMVIFMTDAEDQSQVTVADAVAALQAQTPGSMPHVVGAFIPSAQGLNADCSRDSHDLMPVRLEEFMAAMGGETIALCGPDMAARLTEATARKIGEYVEPSSLRAIELPSAASFESIKVTYGGDTVRAGDVNKGWIYTRSNKTIIIGDDFDYATKPFGTKLVIEYVPLDWL